MKSNIKTVWVRDVDEYVWRQARGKAITNGMKMGDLIVTLLKLWIEDKIKIKVD